jgi:hypothetical protein
LIVNEHEVFGDGGGGVDGCGRGEEADEVGAVAEVGGGVVIGEFREEGPGAGAEHEGEGEGEKFVGAGEGGGVVGEEAEVGVEQECRGEGGFAGAGGRGENDGMVGGGMSEGGGVEDGEPGGVGMVGQAGDFGKEEEACLGGVGGGTAELVIGEDTEGRAVGRTGDMEGVVGRRRRSCR